MTLMARLERVFGRLAIPDLTMYLVAGQAGFLIMGLAHPAFLNQIEFVPSKVMQGEWWRVLTFILYPPIHTFPLFSAFALYMFFLMGTALERNWGTFRYNLYLLIAYVATIAAAMLVPGEGVTNAYITGSVFLAFAQLYPEFVILLFFILPVQIKWLALATWVLYGFSFITGDWMTRAVIVASVLNFLLFFAKDILQMLKTGRRRMERQMKLKITPPPDAPFHTCASCGITDKTHPKMDFRYCPSCGGQLAYCTEHLHTHQHRITPRVS